MELKIQKAKKDKTKKYVTFKIKFKDKNIGHKNAKLNKLIWNIVQDE